MNLRFLLSCWLFLVMGASSWAQSVRAIRIEREGGGRVDEAVVRAFLSIKEGQDLDRESIARDVKALEKSGRFSYVATEVERAPGGVDLVYIVKPKPRIRRLTVEGADEFGNKKVRDLLELGVGDLVDDATVGTKIRAVKEKMQKAYYPYAKITWTIDEQAGDDTADVGIKVVEGRRATVRAIDFSGNAHVPAKDLRKAMTQKKRNIWSWITGAGTYKPDDLETDVEALRKAYLDRGYLDARIGEPQISPRGEKGMAVQIAVDEGPLYSLGSVTLDGTKIFSQKEVSGSITNQPGDIASLAAVEGTQQAVKDFYGSRGYIASEVQYEMVPDLQKKTVDVKYTVKEGSLIHIRNINIRGNTRTKDKVIRREVTVYPGEVYNQVKIRNTERRLRNLGYFEFVNAVPEETPEPGKYDVALELQEQKTGQFLVGVGFSSVDDLIGFAELSQGNFDLFNWPPTGGGQKLKLRGTAGTKRNDIELSFVEPWFLDRRLALGVDLFQHNRRFLSDDYDQRNTGGNVSLGKAVGRFNRLTLTYGLEEIEVSDVSEDASETIKAEEGTQLKSSLTLELSHDTRDNAFVPTKGNRSSISSMVSGGPLGADTQVYGFEGQSSQYWPVWLDHVFNLRGWISTVEEWGDGDRVPIFDRLFLGGARTLRGFKYRDVGPKDEQGEPIGGLSGWYAIAEYSIPLVEKVRFATFYDVGMIFEEAYTFETSGLNSDVGAGLRLDFPGFPIRLDYAWPLEADEFNDRSSGRFQFWIGYGF